MSVDSRVGVDGTLSDGGEMSEEVKKGVEMASCRSLTFHLSFVKLMKSGGR